MIYFLNKVKLAYFSYMLLIAARIKGIWNSDKRCFLYLTIEKLG